VAEETAKLLTGPGDSRLHSAHANALDPTDLLIGKTLQMRKHEGGTLLERQGVQGRVELAE
jgi:hypothetical protein